MYVRYRRKKFTFAISSPDEFLSSVSAEYHSVVCCYFNWLQYFLTVFGDSGLGQSH